MLVLLKALDLDAFDALWCVPPKHFWCRKQQQGGKTDKMRDMAICPAQAETFSSHLLHRSRSKRAKKQNGSLTGFRQRSLKFDETTRPGAKINGNVRNQRKGETLSYFFRKNAHDVVVAFFVTRPTWLLP